MASSTVLLAVVSLLAFSVDSYKDEFEIKQEISQYQNLVDSIFDKVMVKERHQVYKKMETFVDKFGSRPPGSESLNKSTAFLKILIADKFSMEYNNESKEWSKNTATYRVRMYNESVSYKPWERNEEYATIVSPRNQKLNMLGLGFSIPTPAEGITAETVVVRSMQELRRAGNRVRGKIVVFNEEWQGYHTTVWYRIHGASEASRLGAVAVLIRSITPISLQTPHTGGQKYDKDATPIPAACISVEDAEMLQRMQDRGTPARVKLFMSCQTLDTVSTENIVVELRGWHKPEEVVVIGGHIDSWDVGQGAMDNAAGVMISLEAFFNLVLLREITIDGISRQWFPKRTIRLVIWTAEEIGLHGGIQHFQNQKANLSNTSIVMELDTGAFKPTGIIFTGQPQSARVMKEIVQLFSKINATGFTVGRAGLGDSSVFRKAHVPTAMLDFSQKDYDRYFKYHHTEADTMAALEAGEIDMCTAMWTSMTAVLASIQDILI